MRYPPLALSQLLSTCLTHSLPLAMAHPLQQDGVPSQSFLSADRHGLLKLVNALQLRVPEQPHGRFLPAFSMLEPVSYAKLDHVFAWISKSGTPRPKEYQMPVLLWAGNPRRQNSVTSRSLLLIHGL